MLNVIKTRAVWLAVGIVLGGGALSYAGVAATSSHTPNSHANVHATESPEPTETPEPSESPKANDANGQHPVNHGFYVSQAAHCMDVNDTVNKISFTAPADCATNGKAHGAYVKSVAQSDAGKGAHGNAGSHAPTHFGPQA